MLTACAIRELEPAGGFAGALAALRAEPGFWWLDSARFEPYRGRFSYAGADPQAVVQAYGARVAIEVQRALAPELPAGRHTRSGDPLDVLRSLLPRPPAPDPAPELPFVGGAVGCFGYELAASSAGLCPRGEDDLGLPELAFLIVDELVAFDHRDGRLYALGLGRGADARAARLRAAERVETLVARLAARAPAPPARVESPRFARLPELPPPPNLHTWFDEGRYAKAVLRAKECIAAGDVYQVCLTHRIDVPWRGDAQRLYDALRALDPAPYGACLPLPGATLLSSSPECFLSLGRDRRVESRPIKGTRPRGADPARDEALARELAASPKDRAENLMIVDLVRNDLGRVCEIGSVRVPELMAIERYAGVLQMVSTVTGRLRADRDVFDLLRASFPPGSMTGAPKLAAMRILDALEPVRRGFYSGAVGFLDARGGAGLAVVIRTALLRAGRAHLHVGGGIVADSDPAAEWRESWDKARALLAALALVPGDAAPPPAATAPAP